MTEHRPVHGTADDEDADRRFYVAFYEQWSGLLPWKHQNWRDFTLLKIQGEWAGYTGRIELELALLGLQVTLTYIYDHAFNEHITSVRDKIMQEFEGKMGAKEVLDPLGVLDSLDDKLCPKCGRYCICPASSATEGRTK